MKEILGPCFLGGSDFGVWLTSNPRGGWAVASRVHSLAYNFSEGVSALNGQGGRVFKKIFLIKKKSGSTLTFRESLLSLQPESFPVSMFHGRRSLLPAKCSSQHSSATVDLFGNPK